RGVTRAVLILENRLSRSAFTLARLDTVQLIAGQLTVSLDNALLYESLEQKVAERTDALAEANERLLALSVTDALTGLPNRRRLSEVLERVWQTRDRPVAVIVIDVDHFKRFNDSYGHLAGDDCLRQVATAIREQLRGDDMIFRYGGEEFLALLPNCRH